MAKHAENPAAKNEFLSDLNKIDLGEMKAKVCSCSEAA